MLNCFHVSSLFCLFVFAFDYDDCDLSQEFKWRCTTMRMKRIGRKGFKNFV